MNLPSQTKSADNIPPQEALLQMTMGFAITQCIFAAAKLGIADLLKEGAKHYDELARATGTHSDSLYRLLRALASVGIFSEIQPNYFELTPLAACLQSNETGSLRDMITLRGEQEYACWGHLIDTLHTGQSAFEHVYGMDRFEYLKQNSDALELYNRAMTGVSAERNNVGITAAYDFSGINKLIDVGGGQGSLLAAILQQNPTLKAILYDRLYTIEKAKNLLTQANVINRCELMSGDFLESVPSGGDVYLLHIVHILDDQKVVKLLQNCHRAMRETGRLLVIERIISEKTPWRVKFADLNMLVMSTGKIRTEQEFRQLFEAAGFKLTRIVPTASVVSMIEGVRDSEKPF